MNGIIQKSLVNIKDNKKYSKTNHYFRRVRSEYFKMRKTEYDT